MNTYQQRSAIEDWYTISFETSSQGPVSQVNKATLSNLGQEICISPMLTKTKVNTSLWESEKLGIKCTSVKYCR